MVTPLSPRDIQRSVWKGLVAYLVLTFSLAWLPAILLHLGLSGVTQAARGDLVAASILYVVTMGWQPLIAAWLVRRWVDNQSYLDHGLKRARGFFLSVAVFAPVALAGAAMVVAWAVNHPEALPLSHAAFPLPRHLGPSWAGALVLPLASALATGLIWLQAFSEEVGWRGYFLPRVMQRFGAWQGLLMHGAAWGLWYAPVLLLASGDLTQAPLRSAGFLLTSMLLGALLGWIRLASDSIIPATVANAVLTLTAGLPLLLQGTDPGLRGSVYGPPGWLPMTLLLVALVLGPCRRRIVTPREPGDVPLPLLAEGNATLH